MLNLPPSSNSGDRALQFLKTYPAISRSLLLDCGHDIDKISTLVEPILEAPLRCATAYYIQAVTTGRTAFLTTNLVNPDQAQLTSISSTWLIGRSRNCAISVSQPSISRCHAVIGHSPEGFYVMDVGSSNGTFLREQRLPVLERRALIDGDRISLSHLQVEFFVVSMEGGFLDWGETTRPG
ncbi:MAG: FHA domain-containing protein [Leptolyngbya sp. Prado105]|jgi:pSer/pThr/pTyr-binding forkhead associated (FHA) protein|nr:FHA domain-containing protein [Leptolyngbya sp. Prado105]